MKHLKPKLLSLLLAFSLLFNVNCLQTEASSVENFVEKKSAVVEAIDIPENPTWDDLQLHRNIYDDVSYEQPVFGPPEAPVIEVKEEPKDIYMGKYKITYYCPCYECSEGHGHNTATGKRAKEGRTIAVDPRVIPYGTHVLIEGHEYVAEDCGGAIKQKKIDIFLESHAETERRGIDYYDVYILRD